MQSIEVGGYSTSQRVVNPGELWAEISIKKWGCECLLSLPEMGEYAETYQITGFRLCQTPDTSRMGLRVGDSRSVLRGGSHLRDSSVSHRSAVTVPVLPLLSSGPGQHRAR